MKNSFQICLLIAGLIVLPLLAGCSSSVSVDSEWMQDVDFDAYKSYTWIPKDDGPENEQQLPEHLDLRLRRVVDEILIDEKGFDKARSPADADFLLVYYMNTKKATKVDYTIYAGYSTGYGYGYGPGYYGSYGGHSGIGYSGGSVTQKVREYTTGTMVLDVFDPKTRILLWTGVIAGDAKYENPSGERVNELMEQMLVNFPPGVAK